VVYQKEIVLEPKRRGFHLISDEVLNHLPSQSGIVNIFIKHTSASLTINENADPSVRVDFENHFNKMVSEDEKYFTHTIEGPDDITAASMLIKVASTGAVANLSTTVLIDPEDAVEAMKKAKDFGYTPPTS